MKSVRPSAMTCQSPLVWMTVEDPGTAAIWDASKELATLKRSSLGATNRAKEFLAFLRRINRADLKSRDVHRKLRDPQDA